MNPENNSSKAILVVSFGTSFNQTREVTIDAIESAIGDAYPDFRIYRAWTSKMIIKKLMKRDGVHIDNVTEALNRMVSDGVREVIVQPTHVMNGYENEWMIQDIYNFVDKFSSIRIGTPLLTSQEDTEYVIKAIAGEFSDLQENQALVLMGHGTTHYANTVYAAVDYAFKDLGYSNIHLGTVESYPSLESIFRLLENSGKKKVVLAPFMIVAGDHANNDMASEDPESWRSRFEAAGYQVTCVLKGLGEYKQIQQHFVDHVKDAINSKALQVSA